jgi:hypothetical protein
MTALQNQEVIGRPHAIAKPNADRVHHIYDNSRSAAILPTNPL